LLMYLIWIYFFTGNLLYSKKFAIFAVRIMILNKADTLMSLKALSTYGSGRIKHNSKARNAHTSPECISVQAHTLSFIHTYAIGLTWVCL
ncbi:MAG: hypothetical protein K2O12_01170, partial [Muribaculaceae bacterium]|nr:hypothetical protein [Muribaculaceae bacterium]